MSNILNNRLIWILSLCVGGWMPVSGRADEPTIASWNPVEVAVAEGAAPSLPYRLWVNYADGTGEFRQVKWMNYPLTVEQNESRLKAGQRYVVDGYILGDDSTAYGYPVTAAVQVVDHAPDCPSPTPVAEPLPLNDVQLIGQNRLTHNRNLDIANLLGISPKQMLYNYRDTYGLSTQGYPVSDGWDSPTTKLKGHGTGHYLSALALAYASCPDRSIRKELRRRLRQMVDEMRRCQERTFVYDKKLGRYREARDLALETELDTMGGSWSDFDRYKRDYRNYGYGYMNAIPAQHCALIERYAPYNNDSGVWAPYYTVHKQLAGLIDVARLVDDTAIARKALRIATDMGLWVWNRMHYRTWVKSDGTQQERRRHPGNRYEMWNMYIAGEVGGMQEVLARLSEMTTDAVERGRLLEAAACFDAPAFYQPLSRHVDAIRNRHANQHIPMTIGALRLFRDTGQSAYYHIASSFWNLVQGRYRYAMGGVGNGEMFREPYRQTVSMATNASGPNINETCCAYNLAKLTRDLNGYRPNDARLMDYYERVLYNQIVGSLRPGKYAVVYQYAVGLDASKEWGNETPQSSCCGGTGAENHVRYQEAAYFTGADTLWVALYLPTRAHWRSAGVTFSQRCDWPAERSVISIERGQSTFTMKLRVPYWATKGFAVRLNGQLLDVACRPGSYLEIPQRRWAVGDSVEIVMPFAPHVDYAPDKMDIAGGEAYAPMWAGAIMRGPLVMAAKGPSCWDEATLHSMADTARWQWVPDYDADRHVTHYFRMGASPRNQAYVDSTSVGELMSEARRRIDAQQSWEAMPTKVPADAPWTPASWNRMKDAYDSLLVARRTGSGVASCTSTLNAALAMMRPGNLADLSDLSPLQSLVSHAGRLPASEPLTEALDYARMVSDYVRNGSGTKDLIRRAMERLQAVIDLTEKKED